MDLKVILMLAFGLMFFACGEQMDLPDTVDFNVHIKPLLSDRCFACHGPDDKTREADLSLHTEAGAFAALDGNHFVIKAGSPSQSELYQRIQSSEPDYMMPPPESNLSLNQQEIALIEKWIKQGAEWKEHWSFIPPVRPVEPKLGKWGGNTIDAFVHAKMKTKGLKPNPPSSKEKLIRRLYFDLTGLPPTPAEIDAFVNDEEDDAFDKIVEAALVSPAYGERMAIDWLDLSRYADSHGYQDDRQRTMYPWRNWVIESFNDNMPYDQFVTWQLAGDLLPNASYEQKLATGFNRNHPITQEGGVVQEEYLTEYAADRTDVFATGFLGMTLQCARCHDHKYDPLSQEEFYQTFAFFNNLQGERGQVSYFDLAPVPSMREENPLREAEIEAIKNTIAGLEENLQEKENTTNQDFVEWKKEFNSQQFSLDRSLQEVEYNLDDKEGWLFENKLEGKYRGKVNVNLPPHIKRPTRVAGVSGNALRFDGENFLTLGDVGDFEWNEEFTLVASIKHSGSRAREGSFLARRNGEHYQNGYDLLMRRDNRLGMRLVSTRQRYYVEVATRARVSDSRWHQIVATSDGSGKAAGLELYIDGVKQDLQVVRDSLLGKTIECGNDLLVGHWNHRARNRGELGGFADGAVDNISVFARQLSAVEIKYLAGKLNQKPTAKELRQHYALSKSPSYRKTRNKLDSLRRIDLSIPHVMIMEERDSVYPAHVLDRGMYDSKLQEVSRNTPDAILPFAEELPRNRLGLAQWLFDDRNPLAARVMVNRLWQQLFGRGLVATPEDFGSQGKLPTHPALLDWLAIEFVESGWDMKHMLKLMVSSATYQQAASIQTQELAADPENMWLARGPHRPLTAEMIRDQALQVSGLLNRRMKGKWVKPYQPDGIWKELANQIGENKYRASQGDDLFRRSIYTYFKRTIPPPTMLTLDAPERALCTVKRQMTSTPLQSLILLNDPQYVEAARVLADQLLQKFGSQDGSEEIRHAFSKLTSRKPTEGEMKELIELHGEIKDEFSGNSEAVSEWLAIGETRISDQSDKASLAALAAVVSTIINLDEAKYR